MFITNGTLAYSHFLVFLNHAGRKLNLRQSFALCIKNTVYVNQEVTVAIYVSFIHSKGERQINVSLHLHATQFSFSRYRSLYHLKVVNILTGTSNRITNK
jgi:hypothetical protein